MYISGEPKQGVPAATLSLLAGYLVRVVREKMQCPGCLAGIEAESPQVTLITALVSGIDRGGLSYPTPKFVGFVEKLEAAAREILPHLLQHPHPLKRFIR